MEVRLASIRMKLLGIVLTGVVGMVLVMVISLVAERSGLLEDRKVKTRHLVEAAHSLVQHYHDQQASGALDEEQAKQAALAALRSLRYEKAEYFWVNDMHPRVVMHPIKPELDGKDVSDLKDPNGTLLFREFARVVGQDGAGFVDYLWPKPGSDKPQPKISYVQGFQPWGWVIGSGIYVDDVQRVFYRRTMEIGGIVLVVSLIAAALGWLVGRGIFGSIAAMRDAMRRVQESSDLSQRVDVQRRDELGDMGEAFNAMIASFQDIIRQMIDSAGRVSGAAAALTKTSAQIADATTSQSEAAMSTAAAVEEMSSSIALMAERSGDTDAAATQSEALSVEGGQIVNQSVQEMKKIAGAVQISAQSIGSLNQHSEQIAVIVGVIKEIADQTNLLALNAAIEAARAGEQGRGFAVVADEVRKLAERTAQSTEEIATMIDTIQGETKAAVGSMEQGVTRVNEGVTMSERSHAAMESIRSAAMGVKRSVGEMSLALNEQRAASTLVSNNVEEISLMAERNSSHVQSMASEAAELERLAGMLQTAAGRFRI